MLNLLQSPDSTRNPIFKFIDQLNDPYLEMSPNKDISRGVMRHDTDRNVNDNENITTVRDAERLPFFIISNYYNTVNIATIPIGSALTTESFRNSYRQFNSLCKSFAGNAERWDNAVVKMKMKSLLGIDTGFIMAQTNKSVNNMGEALSDQRKLAYEKIIDGKYKFGGFDSFKQLASMVDADLRSAFPRKFQSIRDKLLKGETIEESFDELASIYATTYNNVDMNDFIIDLQEVKNLLKKSNK